MPQYTNFRDFLRKHKTTEKDGITHTRIGNGNDVLPGKYIIPENENEIFLKLYHKHVFIDKNKEYLTEKQLQNGNAPILIDFDFRYKPEIKERKHTSEHIEDLSILYVEKLLKILDIENGTKIPIKIYEKDNINTQNKDVTKDGIHMRIDIKLDHILQCMLRDEVLQDIDDVLQDLPLMNDYESVLDEGITRGYTNWQLYGSQKSDNYEAYKLTREFYCEVDLEDGDISIEHVEFDKNNTLKILTESLARSNKGLSFSLRDDIKEKYETYKNNLTNKKKKTNNQVVKKFTQEGFVFDVTEITNIDLLKSLHDKLVDDLPTDQYHIKETTQYLMALPEKYYTDYPNWIRCGWALHNTDFRLFISWMLFSSQSNKFKFDDIGEYYELWCNMKDEGLTDKSIMYWCKMDNKDEYHNIRKETVDYYIGLTEQSATEWDIANVLYQLFKDEYRCASIKHKIWYKYKNHKWNEIDSGSSLRFHISKTLSKMYMEKSFDLLKKIKEQQDSADSETQEKLKKKSAKIREIACNLKRTNFKQNIMREAAEIFFEADPHFFERLDKNTNILCFKNGIIDFEDKCFRPGRPEDYVSKSTNINYVKLQPENEEQVEIQEEIRGYMKQLFPIPELNKYMWEHLASTLIGTNKNQTFNIYNGSGRNGKSKLVELMSLVLGDYKGVVPITLVTQKRNAIGSVTPELALLRGIRYAVMNEPSKGERMNDGIMKELTGEDPITGREPFKGPVTFVPQFSLVVCTNNLFDIKTNDDGTWRRIRLCEFLSKFVKNPQKDEENKYQFMIDQDISKKFEKWKLVFMSMLVDIAFKTDGVVEDCDMVLEASNKYRKGQDFLMDFMDTKIEKTGNKADKIKKEEAYQEFKLWFQNTYGKQVPKGKELYEFMDKKLGKNKQGKWLGCRIKYDDEDEDEDDDDVISISNYD